MHALLICRSLNTIMVSPVRCHQVPSYKFPVKQASLKPVCTSIASFPCVCTENRLDRRHLRYKSSLFFRYKQRPVQTKSVSFAGTNKLVSGTNKRKLSDGCTCFTCTYIFCDGHAVRNRGPFWSAALSLGQLPSLGQLNVIANLLKQLNVTRQLDVIASLLPAPGRSLLRFQAQGSRLRRST